MGLRIICDVTGEDGNQQEIVITDDDILELVKTRAKEKGIVPRRGRLLTHYDERIKSVTWQEW